MLTTKQVEQVTRRGVKVAGRLLDGDVENRRDYLWREYFSYLYWEEWGVPSYQDQDFEIIDYDVAAVPGIDRRLFRGPLPTAEQLESGDYVCLLCAAQFFGRFHQHHLQSLIANRFGMPVLNLATGARGPQMFLEPEYLAYIQRARAVLVQVLSGRSTGDDEYPGGMVTRRKSGEEVQRLVLLKELIETDPTEYRRLVRSWTSRYRDHCLALAEAIRAPKILVWMSQRAPEDWSVELGEVKRIFGPFPHLIGRNLIDAVRPAFDAYVEAVERQPSALTFTSRVTGERCPFMSNRGSPQWSTAYYPTQAAHTACFEQVAPLLARML